MKRQSSLVTNPSAVSRNIDDSAFDTVKIVSENLDNIVPVGQAILDSSLDVVTNNVGSINTNASNIDDINDVATDIASVTGVAAELLALKDIHTNLAEILLADDNAITATTQAGIATDAATLATTLLDQFDDRYLGSKDSDPSVDNDGNTLLIGAIYWNNVASKMRVWDGSAWSDSLTLTASSVSTLTNKTINDVSNNVHANALHYAIKANEPLVRGDVLAAVDTLGDGTIIVKKRNLASEPAIGISDGNYSLNEFGKALTVGTYKNYDSTGLSVGNILYPNTSGGFTTTPTIAPGNYNQQCAYVAEINGGNAQLVINFHSGHDSASLVSYDGTTSGLSATTTQDAIDEVEGRLDTAESKLGGIEVGATADQTASEIETLYEGIANTNKYTDAEKTQVANTETSTELDSRDTANRARSNHTGTQTASTISDFDTEVNNNTTVSTSKVVTDKLNMTAITSVTFNSDGTVTIVTP